MNRWKRLFSLLAVFAMLFTMAACGTQKAADETTQAPTTAAQTTAPQTTEAPFDPMAKYDPPITIKVGWSVFDATFKAYGGETKEKNPWVDLYKEYGIILEEMWDVDPQQGTTKLNTAIASGDYPDIYGSKGELYVSRAKNGVSADVTDLLDKYATEHGKEYLNTGNGMGLEAGKVNGRLYGIPLIGNSYDSAMVLYIRNDWLKNLNMSAPTSIDEFMKVAEAFTKNDPDKNNKNDTYGIAIDGMKGFSTDSGLNSLFDMYEAYPGFADFKFTFVKSGVSLVWGGTLPGMKTGLEGLQKMYKEGWIPKDFGVMDTNKVRSEFASGKCGMIIQPIWGPLTYQNDIFKLQPQAEVISVPLPGQAPNSMAKGYLPGATNTFLCISSKSKNPEALVKIFNLGIEKLCYSTSSEEYDKYYGKPGTYTGMKFALWSGMTPLKNYDNFQKLSVAVPKKDPTGLNAEQTSNYNSILKYLEFTSVDGSNAEYCTGWALHHVFVNPNGSYAVMDKLIRADNFGKCEYTAPMTDLMTEKYPTLHTMALETVIKIITGEPVSSYDTFLSNWAKLGGDDVTKEANEWYSANK